MINMSMAPKAKSASKKESSRKLSAERRDTSLPVTLQALRERAGFTKEDGAGADLREFFAESKFSGDPDRRTAVSVVALDTILRDPSFLDATTCFGEGQIDTAVNAATVVLGAERVGRLESISGENDLEELAELCREVAGEEDIKAGVMAARHLWGMFNTVTRSFPSEFFRNGKSDDFQAALLGVSGRHLAVFSPEGMDAGAELSRMVGTAEKIAELGQGGRFHREPSTAEEAAETFLYLCKNGRHAELHRSSLLELCGEDREPSAKAKALCGLKEKKPRKNRENRGQDGEEIWMEDPTVSGNGAFFAGRLFDEVKARYPGYPSPSTESTYWDTCLRHPATHGICSRLYGKMGQLVKSGGAEEGISRAVTNKMVHHNTKFSRLSMLVHLSNGKSFHVHRTRPINWESHGVDQPPFAAGFVNEDGQLELSFDGGEKKSVKKAGRGKGGVSVVGYELRVVNYSHMPWVNKAISQYIEEAPFIKSPRDEHQQIVSLLAKELRGEGVTYRQAFDRAADLYSGLAGRAGTGLREVELLLSRAWFRTNQAEELETEMAGLLREASTRRSSGISDALGGGSRADSVKKLVGNGEEVIQSAVLDLAKACDVLGRYGLSSDKSRKAILSLAGQYPISIPDDGVAKVRQAAQDAGIGVEIRADEAGQIAKLACGVASRAVKATFSLQEEDRQEMTRLLKSVIESGVIFGEDGEKIPGRAGKGDAGEGEKFIAKVEEVAGRLGIDKREAKTAARAGLRVSSNILPEVERAFAEHGGEANPELLDQIVQYAGRHAERNPLTGEELHHRRMVGAGVDPLSLDAPMGEDQDRNLYSVVKSNDLAGDAAVDYDPDEAAFEAGSSEHWMDREIGGEENSPSFISEGGGEFFTPFSTTRIADSLYTVVSTKGTEHQLQMLKDFAGLKVESIAGAGDGQEAKRQVEAMLDMVDEESSLHGEPGGVRRRFLSWIFNSVLNAAGVDGEGFDRLGGIGAASLRKGLFEKIRRHGMPGVVVVEDAQIDKVEEFSASIKRAKSWGYSSVGVCLPKTAEEGVREWSAEGGAGRLVKLLGSLTESRRAISDSLKGSGLPATAMEAAETLLTGKPGTKSSQAFDFLQSSPENEKNLLHAVKIASPDLHKKLVICRMADATGLEVNCLGSGNDVEEVADRTKMDSLVFAERKNGRVIGEAIAGFGIKARVVSSNPEQALHDHVDYPTAVTLKDGSLDKNKLIENTKIPLGRKLLLAAEAAQEALEKSGQKGGY